MLPAGRVGSIFDTDAEKLKSNYDNEEGFAGSGSTVRQLEEGDEDDRITVISLRLRLTL